jgi:hypothetical protein
MTRSARPVWHYKIRVRETWRDENLTFAERRDTIVARLRASRWFRESSNGFDLSLIADELEAAGNARTFELIWEDLYGHADHDRAWLEI